MRRLAVVEGGTADGGVWGGAAGVGSPVDAGGGGWVVRANKGPAHATLAAMVARAIGFARARGKMGNGRWGVI